MFRALGIIAGVLALTTLLWRGFHFSLGPSLEGFFESYETQAHEIFGRFEPVIKDGLSFVGRYVGLDLQLYPQWKHTFVLMWLYFWADARSSWKGGFQGSAVFSFIWGFTIALFAGALSGTVAVDSAASNAMMAFWPIAGFIVYEFGMVAWDAMVYGNERGWFREIAPFAVPGAFTLILVAEADKIPLLQMLKNPGLALLAVFTAYLALLNLWYGARDPKGRGDTWFEAFLDDGNTRIAVDMIAVIGGASFFVLVGMAGA